MTLLESRIDVYSMHSFESYFSKKYGYANTLNHDESRNINVAISDCSFILGGTIPINMTTVSNSNLIDNSVGLSSGGGVSLCNEKSKIKAFGEFVERTCGVYNEHEHDVRIEYGSYEYMLSLGKNCINLNKLVSYSESLYNDSNFQYTRYQNNMPISWMEGVDVTTGDSVWLPAQKVFIVPPLMAEEGTHCGGISTGLACGSCYAQAARSAILEVIERDSLMITWLFKQPGIAIDVDKIQNNNLQTLYSHVMKHMTGEDKLYCFDISKTRGVYTILTFIRNELPSAYGLIISTASHANPEIALLKSIEELCQAHKFAYYNLYASNDRKLQQMEKNEIDDLHKHFFYYSSSRHNRNIDFIFSSGIRENLSNMQNYAKNSTKEDYAYLLELLYQKGNQIFIADVTKAMFRKRGILVLRALVPDYVDLTTNYHHRHQKNSRLDYFQALYKTEFNEEPHPFP